MQTLSPEAIRKRRYDKKRRRNGYRQLTFWIHHSDEDKISEILKNWNAETLENTDTRMSLVITVAGQQTEIELQRKAETLDKLLETEKKPEKNKKSFFSKLLNWLK